MFKECPVFIHVPIAFTPKTGVIVDQHPIATPDNEPIEEVKQEPANVVMDITLRRLERACRPIISDYYTVYLQDHEYDLSDVSDPTIYKEAIVSPQSNF